jgi:hypothetical protein
MDSETSFSSNLQRLVNAEVDAVRNFSALEAAITAASGAAGGAAVVSRKQLKSIAEGEASRLSTGQLDALDAYFRATRSQSLVSLMAEYNRLLSVVARCPEARFMLGERPSGIRDGLSLSKWDFDSMAGFLQSMYALDRGGNLKLRFSEVRMETDDDVSSESYESRFGEEEWYRQLTSNECPIICLGSPRSCHAAEWIMAKMFGIQPFARSGTEGLPFYFGWTRDNYFRHGCSFVRDREPADGLVHPWENRSIIIPGDREYVIEPAGDAWKSYGITVVQRLPEPAVLRAVFCGLSGPETRGAVGIAGQMEVPPLAGDGVAPVAWALSETRFELKNKDDPASARRFLSSEVVRNGVWRRN